MSFLFAKINLGTFCERKLPMYEKCFQLSELAKFHYAYTKRIVLIKRFNGVTVLRRFSSDIKRVIRK